MVGRITFGIAALFIPSICLSQQPPATGEAWNRQVQEQYSKHDVKIRHTLPPYSGMPLVLDLFHKHLEDGMCDPEQHVAWETHYKGIMAEGPVADLGLSKLAEAAALHFTIIDTFAPSYSLPANDSLVVIAKPIAGRVCIPQNRHYVYTKFTLEVLKEFQKGKEAEQQEPVGGKQITAVEFGGTVRFPSGFLETFLLNERGFMEVDEQYVLFLWKQIPADNTYVVLQAYLIQDGLVFPVNANGDAQTVYTKMPLAEFEAKVKTAVERNVDADVFPNVHAPSRPEGEELKK